MKNAIFAAVALAACAAASQDISFKGKTKAEVDRHDWATWAGSGKGQKLPSAAMAEYEELKGRVKALDEAFANAGDKKIFTASAHKSVRDALFEAVQRPLVKNKKREQSAPASAALKFDEGSASDNENQARMALDSLTLMLARFDKNSRWKIMEFVDFAVTCETALRYDRLRQVVWRLEEWRHSRKFEEFDAAFGRFMESLNNPRGISNGQGALWMRSVGLDKFADSGCRKEAFFDRDLRTVDSYLAQLKQSKIDQFKKDANEFTTRWNAALDALRRDNDYFKEHGLNLAPADRKMVDSLLESFSYAMLDAREFVGKAKELVEKIETTDVNSEIYRLRNIGFGPKHAFLCAGSTPSDGCPGYSRRARVALEDCKRKFMEAARKSHGSEARWE